MWGVGDPSRSSRSQGGSWAYAILPFIEQDNMYQNRSWTVAATCYTCSTRRSPEAKVPVNDAYGEYNGGGWKWGKTDYAANGLVIPNRPLCLTIASITDGTSNTILVGEKSMNPKDYDSGTWYWVEPFFTGGSNGTQRGGSLIVHDSPEMGLLFRDNWGSAHLNGAQFAFADGSVRTLSFLTSGDVVHALLTPAGGEIVP